LQSPGSTKGNIQFSSSRVLSRPEGQTAPDGHNGDIFANGNIVVTGTKPSLIDGDAAATGGINYPRVLSREL